MSTLTTIPNTSTQFIPFHGYLCYQQGEKLVAVSQEEWEEKPLVSTLQSKFLQTKDEVARILGSKFHTTWSPTAQGDLQAIWNDDGLVWTDDCPDANKNREKLLHQIQLIKQHLESAANHLVEANKLTQLPD